MKLIIEISDNHFKTLQKMNECGLGYYQRAILNGTPLPKGHGRLIDADKLKEIYPHDTDWEYPVNTNQYVCDTIDALDTIIEADTPKRRKGTPIEENDGGYNCENWIP